MKKEIVNPIVNWIDYHNMVDYETYQVQHIKDTYVYKLQEDLAREIRIRDENHKLLHDRIDKALAILEEGVKFCENDSQGVYDKCNIAINRERKAIAALKGEMFDGQE